MKKEPWYTSITAIIIAMICFWPVGCVFLYMRWAKNKGKYNAINTLLLVGAIFLIFIGIVGMTNFFDSHDMSDFWLALLMFLVPGGICGFFWLKRRKKFKEYKIYLDYVNARKKVKIDALCNRLNVNYDTAISTLTEMITKGLINGYLTDDDLIINGVAEASNILDEDIHTTSKETKIIKCKECGAKNTVIVGQQKECEYCGTLLQ